MNTVVVGAPLGTAGALTRALLAARPGGAVTLLSGDASGLVAALDEPGVGELLWADPGDPGTCDEALVHRQLLHGAPAAVVVAVDRDRDGSWELGEQVARRLPDVPLLLTGPAAAAAGDRLAALATELREAAGRAVPTALLPGADPAAVLGRLLELAAAAAARPALVPARPLGHGHCPH